MMSSRYLSFTNKEDSDLINLVQNHRLLYDINDKDHRDLVLRARVWEDVAKKMDRSVEDCKKRWRSMKDTYYRFRRKNSNSTWILMKRLKFLDYAGRNVEGAPADDQLEENCREEEMPTVADEAHPFDHDSVSETKYRSITPLRYDDVIRLIEQKQGERDVVRTDPIFAFFHSMALSVKKLPPELVAEAKLKICEIVGDLEIKAIRMDQESMSGFGNVKVEEEMSIFEEKL